MAKSIYSIVDWMIPNKAKKDFYSLRGARILSFIHLFLIIIGLFVLISTFFFHQETNTFLILGGVIGLLSLVFIFKKWGNFNLSGNLLSFVFAATLVPAVFETGGLYSDNLLWLSTVPLLSLLFANRKSGLIWGILLILFACLLAYLEINSTVSFREQIKDFPASYFLTSYILLFGVIMGIVLIFAKGQEDIIKDLRGKQRVLRQQKQDLTNQAIILEKAKEKLKSSNQELEQFAYAASHDLKEPLRMIKAFTQLIEKKIGQDFNKETTEYFDYVKNGANRMETLLNDLLDYSKMGSNPQKIETDLNDVLVKVMKNLMTSMKETDTAILANELPKIQSNNTEMTQLFQNLLANSIKFKKEGIPPEIKILHRRENGHHLISVADNGIGIESKNQERVFRIFERLHSKKEIEGSGIGLATCKKIVENLGGKIWVNSEMGDGTTFYFTIPRMN